MRLLPSLAILLCAACAPPNPAPSETATAERSLDGDYVVAFVNEAAPDIGIEGHEPVVTIAGEAIDFQSQCVFDDWTFRRRGEAITTSAPAVASVEMCARGIEPEEEAIAAAFDRADIVRRVRSGLWFSGPGGTVQLRRIPSDKEMAARDVDLSGSWHAVALDGAPLANAIPLEADFEQVWWEPGCALQYREYTIAGALFDSDPVDLSGMAVCDIGFDPELPQIWEAMDAADTIDRAPDGSVSIGGNGRSVRLEPRE